MLIVQAAQVGLVESTPVVLGGAKGGVNTVEVFNLTVAPELHPFNSEFTFAGEQMGDGFLSTEGEQNFLRCNSRPLVLLLLLKPSIHDAYLFSLLARLSLANEWGIIKSLQANPLRPQRGDPN